MCENELLFSVHFFVLMCLIVHMCLSTHWLTLRSAVNTGCFYEVESSGSVKCVCASGGITDSQSTVLHQSLSWSHYSPVSIHTHCTSHCTHKCCSFDTYKYTWKNNYFLTIKIKSLALTLCSHHNDNVCIHRDSQSLP